MRRAIWYAIAMFLGMVVLVAVAESNWFLAAIIGIGLGGFVAMMFFAFPHDAAPPADRRHEATQKRRREQARSG